METSQVLLGLAKFLLWYEFLNKVLPTYLPTYSTNSFRFYLYNVLFYAT